MDTFFWVIVTCHAAWSDCSYDPQPTQGVCSGQAEQINENTDAIAICTIRNDNMINAPASWALEEQKP